MREIVEAVFKASGVDALVNDVNRATESVSGIADKSSSMGDKFASAGKQMSDTGKTLSKSVTLPLTLLGGSVIKTGVEYTNSMAKVQATTGNTADEMVELEEIAREMGATTRYSASESADALSYMALAGWENNQMISALPSVLNLATAGQMDLASASDIVTDMMSMFGIEAEEAGRASDVFAEAQAISNTNVNQLSEALGRAGPSASAVGHSIEETSAVLAVFANQGLKGSAAGTALQAMYRDLQSSAEDGSVAIGEHSVAIYDNEGNMRSMIDIMADVEEATQGMTQEQRESALSAVFQQQSLRGANLFMNEGSESAYGLAEALNDSSGSAQNQADIMDNTLGGSFQRLRSSLEEVALSFFELGEGPIRNLIDRITELVTWFGNLSPETQQVIAIIGVLVASIGPVLIVLGKMATGVSALIKVFGVLVTVGSKVAGAIAFIASPVGLVIAAITALIAIGVALYKNWDVVSEKASEMWQRITEIWDRIVDSVFSALESIESSINEKLDSALAIVGDIWNKIYDIWTSILESIFSSNNEYLSRMMNNINDIMMEIWMIIEAVWTFIRETISNTVGFIMALVTGDFGVMRQFISQQMESIRNVISNVWMAIQNIFSSVLSFIQNFVRGIFEQIRINITNSINSVRSTISNVLNSIRSTFSNIFNSLSGIVSTAFSSVVSAVRGGIERAYSTVTGFLGRFRNAGRNIVTSIADGIRGAVSTVTDAIGGVVSKVRDFLPFSPAKEGPLQDIDRLNFEGPISNSIYGAERAIDKAFDDVLDVPEVEMNGVSAKMNQAVMGLESDIRYSNESEEKRKQPAVLNLRLGNRTYRAFVDDISDQQGDDIDIEEVF